eukprot:TRINITY_DN7501_c0_g1_i3.p1 TRINITY_DN7501_c0_g1~~TRINITY_DN7501_c0_g1_i3.p1  ORF type:complete len:1080 (-),score=160.16 TRINITY_DN7501_c0_g1_i3:72-3311(-)
MVLRCVRLALAFVNVAGHTSSDQGPDVGNVVNTQEEVDVGWVAGDVDSGLRDIAKGTQHGERRLGDGHQGERRGALPEVLDVTFTARGAQIELHLHRNRALLAGGARHILHYRDGHVVDAGPAAPEPCFYHGEVVGDPLGTASVSTCGGVFQGVIVAHGSTMTLQPVSLPQFRDVRGADIWGSASSHPPRRAAAVGVDTHFGRVRHLLSHLAHPVHDDFRVDVARFTRRLFPGNDSSADGRRLNERATKFVEVLAVNDHRRFQAFGGYAALSDLATHTASVLNEVTQIYRSSPTNGASFEYEVQVVLVAQHTLVDEDPWENEVVMVGSETDCSSLLDLFNSWAKNQQLAGKTAASDNRVLLSDRDFDGSTVGLAGVSAMCDIARSGNVNMCGPSLSAVAGCAAVVAHEMGHNFGMRHDSSGNACPSSGLIMEAVGGGDPSTQFSSCSVTYIDNFFSGNGAYESNGKCLENRPTKVFGDPVCGNGFVEEGEDCDCGSGDCSGSDKCCDGATCQFALASYECSDLAGPCCDSCKFVSAEETKVCRVAKNSCDLREVCAGGTAECPVDMFVYPGSPCSTADGSGLCASGKCASLATTCGVEINRDFEGTWDTSNICDNYNDDCGTVVCHDASYASQPHKCGQNFATHGKQMEVPEGTPCWFPGDRLGQRLGMCSTGKCQPPPMLAVVPLCGNGGIDFGEDCDCGQAGGDTCCDCSTCSLKSGNKCSVLEPCCDPATCDFKENGIVCRAQDGECDVAETCSGISGVCPPDNGVLWGTSCTASDGMTSTCYGKVCLDSMDKQCSVKTDGEKPKASAHYVGARTAEGHECKGLVCCESCAVSSGTWRIDDKLYTDPITCSGCTKSISSSTFTVNGVSSRIYLGAVLDGTLLANDSKICVGAEEVTPMSSCSAAQYLDTTVGRCLPCNIGCYTCTGPTAFDCSSDCRYGKDQRGACAISEEQAAARATVTGSERPASASTTLKVTALSTTSSERMGGSSESTSDNGLTTSANSEQSSSASASSSTASTTSSRERSVSSSITSSSRSVSHTEAVNHCRRQANIDSVLGASWLQAFTVTVVATMASSK